MAAHSSMRGAWLVIVLLSATILRAHSLKCYNWCTNPGQGACKCVRSTIPDQDCMDFIPDGKHSDNLAAVVQLVEDCNTVLPGVAEADQVCIRVTGDVKGGIFGSHDETFSECAKKASCAAITPENPTLNGRSMFSAEAEKIGFCKECSVDLCNYTNADCVLRPGAFMALLTLVATLVAVRI
jgi:hypothetical protein